MKAEEFIDHNEIMATLEYAAANKNNAALISEIIEKAKLRKATAKQRYCWTANWRIKTRKFLRWQNR